MWRNFYVRSCVRFTFANKIEAMRERSLLSEKVEPRSTSRIRSAVFTLPLFYLRDDNLRAWPKTRQWKSIFREAEKSVKV